MVLRLTICKVHREGANRRSYGMACACPSPVSVVRVEGAI